MIVEQIYLENNTTRKAFYHVKIVKDDTGALKQPYRIEVQWGRLGTEGRTTIKKRASTIEPVRLEMHKLAEAKKMRHYHETQLPKAKAKKTLSDIQKSQPTLSPDAQRFLSLELE